MAKRETKQFEPLEARGEDPEIDLKATEDAFYNEEKAAPDVGRIRKFSDAIMEAVEAAAEKVAEGSRHISDHWREDGESIAAAIFGGGGSGGVDK